MRLALILACGALCACQPKVVTRDTPVIVKTPVGVPCVSAWPQKPAPLPEQGHWAQMDVRQKSAALGVYAIDMTNYAGNLEAATGGCD